MLNYLIVPYNGPTPGANTNTVTLFDSVVMRAASRGGQTFADFARYLLALRNSAPGTLKAYASKDSGVTWLPADERAVAAASATRMNQFSFSVAPHLDVKIEWVNGGSAQSPWYVAQALDDGQTPLRSIFVDAAGGSDPAQPASSVTTLQLPSSLGQKTSAQSLSVVEAVDSKITKAASLRGYVRGEGLPIAVTTTSKTFAVPAAWLGKHVRLQADGGDAYYQISTTSTPAAADPTARAVESGSPTITLSPTASGNGCGKLPRDMPQDIPFPTDAVTFALIGTAAQMAVRTHPAES